MPYLVMSALPLFVVFALAFCPTRAASAAPPLTLHATPQEVALWRQRSQRGPFQPEWDRILARAIEFRSKPDMAIWPGNQTQRLWQAAQVKHKQQRPNYHPGRKRGGGLRDAGLAYLVTGDTRFREAVRQTLLKQVAMPGTDFSQTSHWNWREEAGNSPPDFEIANWVRKLAYGYSYVRANLAEPDRAVIDPWFRQAAIYFDTLVDNGIKRRFPHRDREAYGTPSAPYNPGHKKGITHWGGHTVYRFHRAWLNLPATYNAAVAVVGVLLDDPTLKDHAARFVREWLMFNVAPDGTVADQFRWSTRKRHPALWGYHYAGTVIGSIVTTVDHLARAGDTSLYDYETSVGHYGWGGAPKSLKRVLHRFAQLTLSAPDLKGDLRVYASRDNHLQPTERIGPRRSHIHAIHLAPANIYYQDPLLSRAYQRKLPVNAFGPGCNPRGGDWCTYPSILLMFGHMEGLVWPYPTIKP